MPAISFRFPNIPSQPGNFSGQTEGSPEFVEPTQVASSGGLDELEQMLQQEYDARKQTQEQTIFGDGSGPNTGVTPGGPAVEPQVQQPTGFDQSGQPQSPVATPTQSGQPAQATQAPAQVTDPLDALEAGIITEQDARGGIVAPTELPYKWTASDYFANYLRGANKAIATGISAPLEVSNDALGLVGMGIFKPGAATELVRQDFEALGISTRPLEGLSGEIGYENVKGLAQLSMFMAAAPRLAAQTGYSTAAYVTRNIGDILRANPGLNAIIDVGASTGGAIGKDLTGSELAAIPGAVIGGMGASGAVSLTKATGRGLVAGGRGVVSYIKGTASQPPGTALRDPYADPARTRVFAQDQIEGATQKLETAIQGAINDVPTTGSPQQVQARVRDLLARAERIGNRVVSDFWERTPLDNPVPMTGIRQEVTALQRELRDTPSVSPEQRGNFLSRLHELSMPTRGDDGRMVPSLPTIRRLRDFRGEIRRARLTEEGQARSGLPVNEGLVRNYNRLESIIDDNIQRAVPTDVTIQQARAMSIKYNDIFSRGALSEVLARRQRGDDLVPPGQSVEYLMSRFGGLREIVDARDKLVYTRAPDGQNFAVTAAEHQELQQLTREAENSIRSMFRDAAATKGPEGAAQFVRRNEAAIRPLARVHAELEQSGNALTHLMQQEKIYKQSALTRFAQEDAQRAIQRIWNAGDPKGTAKTLMQTFKNDQDALEGLRGGVLDELRIRSRGDAILMKNIVSTPRVNDMLSEILSPDQFARMNKLISITNRIANGDEKLIRHMFKSPALIAARVIGAGMGHQVSRVTGGGAIQAAAIGANTFKQVMEKVFKSTDPGTMLNYAILDPKWEKIILSREPHSSASGRELVTKMRRIVSHLEGFRQAEQKTLGRPEPKSLDQLEQETIGQTEQTAP